MRTFRLTLKIAIPLFILLFLMIAMAVSVLITQSLDRDEIAALSGSVQKQSALSGAELHYTKLLMAENSFALTGLRRYRESFATEKEEVGSYLNQLESLQLSPSEQHEVDAFQHGLEGLDEELDATFGNAPIAVSAKVQQTVAKLDDSAADSLAMDISAFSDCVDSAVRQDVAQMKAADVREFWLTIIPILIALPIALAVVFFTMRRISRPLLQLVHMAEKITKRDFSTRMRTISLDEIGMLTRAFNAMAEEIQRRYGELESFAYIVAHDLKNPIGGISGMTELVLADAGERISAEERESLESVVETADSMTSLVTDLLEFASAGKVEFAREPVSMDEMLRKIKHELMFMLKEKGGQIVIQEGLPSIYCDPMRFSQIWKNLISNGLKYNDKANPRVEISCEDSGDGMHAFHIADNGIGLNEKDYEVIFQPFHRTATTEEYEGTGIGLSIVKRVVDFHGGKVWVTSRKGEGTTFHFTVPRASLSGGLQGKLCETTDG